MQKDRFEELLGQLLDDDIAAGQIDELVELVAADSQKLGELRKQLNLSDRLSQYEDELRSQQRFFVALATRTQATAENDGFVECVAASAREANSVRRDGDYRKWNLGAAGWLVAAVAVSIAVAMFVVPRNGVRQRGAPPPQIAGSNSNDQSEMDHGVAVLTAKVGLEGKGSETWCIGATVPPKLLTWEAGLIQLEFYCGATVVVEGPASIEILDAMRVVCRSGKLRAKNQQAGQH